ncbi:MAG: isochorismatase family cysteine hydrolase [Clostridia bacterium]|nr:isochorismatase family cysteine hydrolase [Clostridia bacterium]
MKKLLLVIDMINGFVKKGALADNYINNITPNIIKLIKEYIKNNNDIITIQEGHTKNSKEFNVFPLHCIIGTEEAELINELLPYEKNMQLIRKNSTCGFITNKFMKYIEENKNKLDEVVLTGCCTDLCVINFALPLKNYINENNLDIKVTIYKNCVETYNSPTHNREEYNKIAFKIMEQNGIKIK